MPNKSGFTLLEISIVLVIIGLIVGGVMVGRSLIRSAQLQSVIADTSRYEKAVQLFKEKYRELPGDMPNAESFWGSDAGCPNTVTNTVAKQATCNGNGNGHISDWLGNVAIYESFRAWQQLANSGFITGAFSGVAGPLGDFDSTPNVNTPVSKVFGNVYFFSYFNYPVGSLGDYPIVGHRITIAGKSAADGSPTFPIIAGPEAQNLDDKIDDGRPGTGKIVTWKPAWMSCADNANPAVAKYIISDDTIRCALKMTMDF